MTDPVREAVDLFEHMLDKTALVWFQTNRSKFKDLTTLKTMFLQRYNPWGKTKREQLQSWNILSFNPKTTDVDEHIDLINTLGDMVDQKEEAKKDTQWTKKRVKYLNHLKAQNQNKPEVEENLKENLMNKDRTHQKPKRQTKLMHTKTLTITITMPQVRVKATDPIMVKTETGNFKGSHNEIEAKDLSIVNVSFKIIAIREAHHNKIIRNTAMVVNPISRGIMVIHIEAEAEAVAMDLSNSEDAVVVGPIIRTTTECISISITHTTHNQNNMVLPAVYVADLTIPPNTATRVNMT